MKCDKDGNDLERERLLEIERRYEAGLEVAIGNLSFLAEHGYIFGGGDAKAAIQRIIDALKGGE